MLGERLFRVCDRDRDNAIDFQEFLSAIALLVHGTEEDRYRLLFDVRATWRAQSRVRLDLREAGTPSLPHTSTQAHQSTRTPCPPSALLLDRGPRPALLLDRGPHPALLLDRGPRPALLLDRGPRPF